MPKLIDHDERREHLAAATWRIILRDGVAGVSVRTVAAEAGLSTGSLRHIFATQTDLLVFALQLVVDQASERMMRLSPRATALETVEAMASELMPLDRERRAEMEVYLALFTAANANPDLRATRDAAHRKVRGVCSWIIGELADRAMLSAGTDRELEATRLHALIDGLAAHIVYAPPESEVEWARRALAHHLRSLCAAP